MVQTNYFNSPFRVPVEVVTLYSRGGFLETNVVEAGKTGPVDVLKLISFLNWCISFQIQHSLADSLAKFKAKSMLNFLYCVVMLC